jgi:hypothetical protein
MAKPSKAARAAKKAGLDASKGRTSAHLTNEQFLAHLHGTLPSVGPRGRFGDNKVFIDAAHRAFARTSEGEGITLEAFKSRLVELNTARKIDLSRADLVEAMNPESVRQSETRHMGASFHFIRIR